ncbi:MAG TPA: LiaF domain-containing protein [Mucilaginibacter sp.]
MDNDIVQPKNPRNGKALAGIILLAVGMLLLVKQLDFFFVPNWLFSWPMWLIGWGLFIGAKSNFHKPSSFLLIVLGILFLLDDNIHNADRVVWPLGIIAFGLWMILRRHHHFDKEHWKKSAKEQWSTDGFKPNPDEPVVDYAQPNVPPVNPTPFAPTGDDYLDTVSVFGSVKKTVLSKNFKGGEIVNIFGGAELDFTQADISGRVIIDITQIFGGVKMIVPPHWQVVPDIAAVFAGIEDKRLKSTATAGSEKVLVLKGVSIFAGVDIRSY